ELASVSNMLTQLERDGDTAIRVERTTTPGGKSVIQSIRYVPPPLTAAGPDEQVPQPNLHPHPVAVEALLRELVSQLDYQREQLDYQSTSIKLLAEHLDVVSKKLDYVAGKVNGIAKAVKA
ncbi:MAG: hypothetical protein L0Y66_20535, partial [Myxococcaceae bacterium]|nr:hypothetical protein [Myxococcaceae bacterium]